jgi:hypothetical protein
MPVFCVKIPDTQAAVKCPALQVLHDDDPLELWYWPAAQAIHDTAPAVLEVWYCPGLQLVHAPLLAVYSPLPQELGQWELSRMYRSIEP